MIFQNPFVHLSAANQGKNKENLFATKMQTFVYQIDNSCISIGNKIIEKRKRNSTDISQKRKYELPINTMINIVRI